MMKFIMSHKIAAAIIAAVITAGTVTGVVLANKSNTPEEPQNNPVVTQAVENNSGNGNTEVKTVSETDTTVYHEVKFAMPVGLKAGEAEKITLPETLMLADGTTFAELPSAKEDGKMFLGWYYDDGLTYMSASSDVVDHNITLYPRFGTKEGMDGTFSYDYVAKRDVDKNYQVLVVSHNQTTDDVKQEIAVRNLTKGGEDIDFTLEKYNGAVAGLISGDASYEPDEEIRELLKKVSIDPDADTLPDLYELYGLSEEDSPERYWREELRLDPDKVVLLQDAVLHLQQREWDRADIYIVHPVAGAWTEGSLQQVEIKDTASLRFVFEDEETDERIVYHNFTVTKAEYNDVKLSSSMVYIPLNEVEGVDDLGSLLKLVAANDSEDVVQAERSGIMTTAVQLAVGTKVAVYDGTLGEGGTVDGDISYFKITEVLGDNRYAYEGAAILDIIDTPVVIPVKAGNNPASGTITLTAEDLTFDKPIHEVLRLNGSTKVQEGSFIMFYEGQLPTTLAELKSRGTGYGRITGVTPAGNALTVTYEAATVDDMHRSQGMYTKVDQVDIPVTEQEVENIRQGLLNQMEESGYADAVGNYIVALINGDVEMPDDPEIADSLKNIAFKTDTGEDISLEELRPLAAGQKVEFSGLTAGFTIAPKLEHFSGTGIRAVFHAGFTIKIHMNEDNILEIQCVAQIEQEILLGYNLDFEIEWDVIIPVDATIDAALQAGTFTCFSAQATIMTKTDEKETDWARLLETTGAGDNPNKKDAQDLVDLSKQLKTMSKNLEKVQGGGQYSKQKGEAVQHGAASEADTGAGASMGGDLPTKYSQMLENDAEYVPIIKQELFALEFHLDPWHVIAVGFSADFVLSWKLNAMIGFSISYGNAKQFCYHVSVAAGTVEKQVGDLETPNFRIDFFLFGMVGVRAGVEFELRLGLISTKLDSIGISAEIGVYMELYGFLYMYYAWRSGEEPDSGIMGSLLFEIGAYLEINFKAQLGDEALSYEKTLYEKKWPFLTLGAESVPVPHPVNTDEDDEIYEMLEIEKGKNTVKVPDSVFKVYSMALESGELSDESWDSNKVGEKNYSFSINGREYTQYNEEHFTVSCVDLDGEDGRSNGKHSFQYLPATNEIYVKPVDNDKDEYWGEITFIYTNDSFGFTTVEIKRTLKVHWKGEAMTAVVEYYLQNEDRTGYDLVKYGGFDGFDGIEYDLIVNEDFIFQFPGYYLVGVNYPGTKDMDAKEKEVYAELQDVQEKYRRKEVNSKVLAAANEKWNQFYDRYQNYYENILNTMKTYKGVLYFLMVKNETVVKLYFDRQPDHTINPYIVYNKPMTGGRYFTLGSMEIRGGENFLERLVEASEWFRKTYHYELEWYYVPKSGLESYPRTTIVDDQGRTGFTYQKNAISEDGTVKYYLPTFRTAYFDEVKDLLSNASGWKPVTENTTMPDEGIIVIGYTYAKTPAKVIWTSENGETVYREDVCQYMDHVLDPPDITGTLPAKKGYSYKIDWYNDYNQAINSFGYVLTEELVYSARVSLNPTYQKIYLEIDGEREYYTSQRTDEVVKLSRLKDKEGYTMKVIAVWDDGEIEITKDSVIHMPSSDLTLKITYTINSYNVQWVDGGNVIKEETLEFGSALTPPEVSVNTAGNEALIWQIDGKKLSNPATVPGRDVVITADRHIHDYVDTIIRKSSCSQQGKVRHTCSICGEIKDEALPLDPESHQWLAGEIIPATCVDPSGRDYWCSRCGQHRTEYDDESTKNPGNHVGPSRIVDGYPETCTEDGLADAYYCEACGELMHGGTKIPAKGHYWSEAIYAWAANNMTVTATHYCLTDLSHSESETADVALTITDPTETAPGRKILTATFTNPSFATQTKVEITSQPLGPTPVGCDHNWNYVEITHATCTEAGLKKGTCSKCGAETEEIIPALGHDWDTAVYEWIADESTDPVSYTVTATHTCKRDATHTESETVRASNRITTDATTTTEGVRTYTATFTKEGFETQTRTAVVPVTGCQHEWEEVITKYPWAEIVEDDEQGSRVQIHAGEKIKKCKKCQETKNEDPEKVLIKPTFRNGTQIDLYTLAPDSAKQVIIDGQPDLRPILEEFGSSLISDNNTFHLANTLGDICVTLPTSSDGTGELSIRLMGNTYMAGENADISFNALETWLINNPNDSYKINADIQFTQDLGFASLGQCMMSNGQMLIVFGESSNFETVVEIEITSDRHVHNFINHPKTDTPPYYTTGLANDEYYYRPFFSYDECETCHILRNTETTKLSPWVHNLVTGDKVQMTQTATGCAITVTTTQLQRVYDDNKNGYGITEEMEKIGYYYGDDKTYHISRSGILHYVFEVYYSPDGDPNNNRKQIFYSVDYSAHSNTSAYDLASSKIKDLNGDYTIEYTVSGTGASDEDFWLKKVVLHIVNDNQHQNP